MAAAPTGAAATRRYAGSTEVKSDLAGPTLFAFPKCHRSDELAVYSERISEFTVSKNVESFEKRFYARPRSPVTRATG